MVNKNRKFVFDLIHIIEKINKLLNMVNKKIPLL